MNTRKRKLTSVALQTAAILRRPKTLGPLSIPAGALGIGDELRISVSADGTIAMVVQRIELSRAAS